MATKKKKIPWSLQQLCVKSGLMATTIVISLYCGIHASYASFYLAVFVQALNNAYESFHLLQGYNAFITIFHLFSFLGAIICGILAVLHLAGANVDSNFFIWLIIVCLCIPILHFLIEVYCILRAGTY